MDEEPSTAVTNHNAERPWSPASWRQCPIAQQPQYADADTLRCATDALRDLPPLVHVGEVDRLRELLAMVANGGAFLLQGGDCAELFEYCTAPQIENRLKILLQMSLVLTYGARVPIVRIGRLAGQYAKPRTNATETVDGVALPVFRGHIVNGYRPEERSPSPNRLLQAYFHSAATLNYLRALVSGGFADLRHPDQWTLHHVQEESLRLKYKAMVHTMLDSLDFVQTIHAASTHALSSIEFYTSHEGLLLDYEEALTRMHPPGAAWYNLGAHFLWIGDRTRQLDHAHVEYFRGIANPIGIKVGPSITGAELVELLHVLDPLRQPGRITLITRYGHTRVAACLPEHIRAVASSGHRVVWCCDPMHGNTITTAQGLKTRYVDHILEELRQAFSIHRQHGRALNGVHFELTGDDVTECIGGSAQLNEDDLTRNYRSFCDPRLNYGQSLDMAFRVAEYIQQERSIAGSAPKPTPSSADL